MPKPIKQKREEAEDRQEAASKRRIEDQLTRLETRPGASAREHAKLMGRIEKRGKTNG